MSHIDSQNEKQHLSNVMQTWIEKLKHNTGHHDFETCGRLVCLQYLTGL